MENFPIETIKIKFSDLDRQIYYFNNTSLEINYKCHKYDCNGIYFNYDNIINFILIEVIVGFSPESDNNFEVKDLENVLGTNSINKNGIVIKIPRDFDEDLSDFSIILFNYNNYYYDIHISYDDLKYIIPSIKQATFFPYNSLSTITPIVPLFKVNPYNQISYNDNNKYIYILIYNYNGDYLYFSIKNPMILNESLDLNTINIIPKPIDQKYYYHIKIPKGDYNSLLIKQFIHQII